MAYHYTVFVKDKKDINTIKCVAFAAGAGAGAGAGLLPAAASQEKKGETRQRIKIILIDINSLSFFLSKLTYIS